MLSVCLPGTGGMIPLPNRFLTCCWMQYQASALLIDCGEGTQIALRAAGCRLSRLDTLLLTHFHADHTAGLPGLLLSLGNTGKTSPLLIVGPAGVDHILEGLLRIAPALPYPIHIAPLPHDTSGSFSRQEMEISYLPLKHSIPCFGYRVDVARKPVFLPEQAKRLGVPKTDYKKLHDGQSVTLPDGRVIAPELVLGEKRPSLRVCYCTDTLPIASLIPFAQNADLLISEGMYGDADLCANSTEKMHMFFSDSARIAQKAAVKRLWLTHYSPAMEEPSSYLSAAQEVFPKTETASDGIWAELPWKESE